MRYVLIIAFLSVYSLSFAQFTEDFSDGDFTSNPVWSGDISKFTIENQELRSNSNTASDVFHLSTPSTLAKSDLEWRFRVNMKFSTSGANYTDVFLMADNADLTSVTNGYFVRIGNTKDEVSLYKIVSGTETQLTDGTDSKTHNKNINIKVTKSAFGTWAVSADYSGGKDYTIEGTTTDNDVTTSTHFGFLIKQSTASFHLKHFYDDIYVGPLVVDTQKPTITSTTAIDKNNIRLLADEPVSSFGAGFSLNNGYGVPDNVVVNGNEIVLTYNTDLVNNNYNLTINLLSDLSGNQLDSVVKFDYFEASKPNFGDILLTEVFADPTPSVGLPDAEYIEVFNASSEPLDLENCTFSDGGSPAIFPKVLIPSMSYAIVTKTRNGSLFSSFGQTVELDGFPALNNSGDNLILKNESDETLDSLNYTDQFYKDDIKDQGGYSIERIDFVSSCAPIDNWTASNSTSGGTPGNQNSVLGANPDQQAPQVVSVLITASNELSVSLDENILPVLSSDISNFEIVETSSNPVSIDVNDIEHILTLTFTTDFESNATYTLLIKEMADCKGNEVKSIAIQIVTTEKATDGDIIINELLFNPKDDGVDFIELYNKSSKYIELSSLLLARYDKEERKDFRIAGTKGSILYPNEYVAISTDTVKTKEQYSSGNVEEISSLPAMSNSEGIVLLFNSDTTLLDSVPYNENQHFELLSSTDGVSLERISFKDGYTSSNWHSASTSVGFATPGYQNSQFLDLEINPNHDFSLQSKTFSPDGDGYQDVLTLTYSTADNGYTLNGYVYSLSGQMVDHIFNNETLSTSGLLSWDGVKQNGTKIPIGNYILLLEYFNLEGKVERKKFAFSVLGQF